MADEQADVGQGASDETKEIPTDPVGSGDGEHPIAPLLKTRRATTRWGSAPAGVLGTKPSGLGCSPIRKHHLHEHPGQQPDASQVCTRNLRKISCRRAGPRETSKRRTSLEIMRSMGDHPPKMIQSTRWEQKSRTFGRKWMAYAMHPWRWPKRSGD